MKTDTKKANVNSTLAFYSLFDIIINEQVRSQYHFNLRQWRAYLSR